MTHTSPRNAAAPTTRETRSTTSERAERKKCATPLPTAEEEAESARESEAPACRAGGLVLFDFRIIHGGLASIGRERPIAYVICSTGGAVDDSNFPDNRICDATAEDLEEFPFWHEIDFVQ